MSNVNEQVGLSDTQLASCTTLRGLLEALKRGDDNPAPWLEEGLVSQISEEAYFEYLEMLPPRWMRGSSFIYAEGSNAFLLCWQHNAFFARQLTEAETARFCVLAGISRS